MMITCKPSCIDFLREQYFLKNNKRLSVTKLGDKVVAWKRYTQNPEIVDAQFVRTKRYSAIANYNKIGILTHCKLSAVRKEDDRQLVITTKFLDFIERKKKILRREFLKNKDGIITKVRKSWASVYFSKSNIIEEIKLINMLERG